MTNHKTVVIDGKVVHIHEFEDGSTIVTGVDEVVNKATGRENYEENTPADLRGVRKSVAIPYVLSAILVALPTLLVIGAAIYALIDVLINGYTYRV